MPATIQFKKLVFQQLVRFALMTSFNLLEVGLFSSFAARRVGSCEWTEKLHWNCWPVGYMARNSQRDSLAMFSLKKKSLRLPTVRRLAGQSLRDERERLLENRFIPLYFATVFAWITWLLEWTRLRQHIAPQPKLWLMAAIIGTGVCAVVVRRLINHWRQHKLPDAIGI